MKLFLDTSSLLKLYHNEIGTKFIEEIFVNFKINTVFLSEISKIEFASTIWKKVRMNEISEKEAINTKELFEKDQSKYTFITTDSSIIENSSILIQKYGTQGLRTLDSIQLASALEIKSTQIYFLTSDILLKNLMIAEGLQTEIP